MKKIAIYYRSNDSENDSQNQIRISELQKFANEMAKENQTVEHFFDFQTSGMEEKREQLSRMINRIKEGQIGTVVTSDMDRLGRKHSIVIPMLETLRKHEVILLTTNTGKTSVTCTTKGNP